MNVREAYAAWAAIYDSNDNPTRDLDAAATRATLAGVRAAAILELGCGTGKNTAFLATIGDRVHALDFSAEMLARARARVDAANVSFTVADVTRPWPCADRAVDLIVVNLVLEHVEQLGPVFAEAARCLQPGGRMFVSELHPFKQYGGTRARFEQDGERVEVTAFVHHLSDFTDAAREHGFTIERVQERWPDGGRATPPQLLTLLFRLPASPD